MLRVISASRWRRLAAALLAAPALTLPAAVGVVWANDILASGIPLGIHTLVPLSVLVPLPVLAAVAAGGLIAALAMLVGPRQPGRYRPIGGTQTVALLAAAQVVVFACQLLAVDQLRGVPDPGLVLVAAALIQGLVVAVLAATLLALELGLPDATELSTPWLGFPAPTITLVPVPVPLSSDAYRTGPRRGPPISLLSD